MGLRDILLGESPEAVVESRDVINSTQKEALKKLLEGLQTTPPPDLAVPLTAGQEQLATSAAPGNVVAQGEVTTAQQALQGILSNPAGDFQDQVEDPLIHDFNTRIMPQISRGFGNDFFSSERQTQDRFATDDLLRALAKEKSSFLRDDRTTQVNAAGVSGSLAGDRGDILASFLESAGIPRTAEVENLLNNESARQELLKLILSGAATPTIETVGISKGGSSGLLGGVLQGAAQGLASK